MILVRSLPESPKRARVRCRHGTGHGARGRRRPSHPQTARGELRDGGVQGRPAADGAEGLERAREVLPDIVILDVIMPRMTGYEVAQALRDDADRPHPDHLRDRPGPEQRRRAGHGARSRRLRHASLHPLDLIARVNTLLARNQALTWRGTARRRRADPCPPPGPHPASRRRRPSSARQPALAETPPYLEGVAGPGRRPASPPPARRSWAVLPRDARLGRLPGAERLIRAPPS